MQTTSPILCRHSCSPVGCVTCSHLYWCKPPATLCRSSCSPRVSDIHWYWCKPPANPMLDAYVTDNVCINFFLVLVVSIIITHTSHLKICFKDPLQLKSSNPAHNTHVIFWGEVLWGYCFQHGLPSLSWHAMHLLACLIKLQVSELEGFGLRA